MKTEPKIVCLGGGIGTVQMLRGLRLYTHNITGIVSMADDGGSGGRLRRLYSIPPPGDLINCLAALSNAEPLLLELLTYRFKGGALDQQSAGSIFLTSLEQVTGSFEAAITAAAQLLEVRGEVLPVTLDNVQLCAELEDGTKLHGEKNIDVPNGMRASISRTWLEPEANINPKAQAAFAKADLIVIGPGDLYTSLIPNLLVKGVPEAITQSRAKKIYIGNLMTKYGETQNFGAEDFVRAIEEHLSLDHAVFNTRKPAENVLLEYKKEKSEYISPPVANKKYILADILSDEENFIRHDNGEKLAQVLLRFLR